MKKYFTLLLALLFMVGCAQTSSSTSHHSEDPQSSLVSEDNSVTSVPESSETPSSVPPSSVPPSSSEGSSETPTYITDIAEIKELAKDFKALANAGGFYKSNILARVKVQVLTAEDYGTTKNDVPRYSVFAANETGYITIHVDFNHYDTLDDYIHQQQVNTFTGYIAFHLDEISIDARGMGKPVYHANESLNYDYRDYAIPGKSVSDLVTRSKAQMRNLKGQNRSPFIYKHTWKYLMKIESAVALFTDGVNTVYVHGHQYINGGLTVGNVYDVYGREGFYKYRPQLEFIRADLNNNSEINLNLVTASSPMTGADLYKLDFTVDDGREYVQTANMEYADALVIPYKFNGYVNYYWDGYKSKLVLTDKLKETDYATKEAAIGDKALFLNNDEYDSNYLYEYAPRGVKAGQPIEIYFVGYMHNSNHYWQIQVFTTNEVKL